MYYVQETIGGWRQNPCFQGTYEECQEYYENNNSNKSLAIVSEDELEVDYL